MDDNIKNKYNIIIKINTSETDVCDLKEEWVDNISLKIADEIKDNWDLVPKQILKTCFFGQNNNITTPLITKITIIDDEYLQELERMAFAYDSIIHDIINKRNSV
jgi:hypothetical protein